MNFVRRAFLISLYILFIPVSVFSIQPNNFNEGDSLFEDDTFFSQHGDRKWGTGLAGFFLPNIAIASWNRFVADAGYAKVDYGDAFDTMIHGQNHWEWDTDWYTTNFILHPYQGSLSYDVLRSSNFSPFESLIGATVSSFIWETMCETTLPSYNDMVYTSLGSIPLGEMLHRLSFEADAAAGPLRFLVSPVRLYTEPISRSKPYGTHGNIKEFSFYTGFEFSQGFNYTNSSSYPNINEKYPAAITFRTDIVYGDSFNHTSADPFSTFSLSFGVTVGKGCGEGYRAAEKDIMHNIFIFSDGFIFSHALEPSKRRETTVGMVLDYDILWHSFMNFTTLAPGFGVHHRYSTKNASMELKFHLDAIALGTTDCLYFRRHLIDDEKIENAYTYTVGGQSLIAIKIRYKKMLLKSDDHLYVMYDFKDSENNVNPGLSFIRYHRSEFSYQLENRVILGCETTRYYKLARYDDFPTVFSQLYSLGLFVRFSL